MLDRLLRRHEVLRARLVRGADGWSLDIPTAPPPGVELLRRVAVEPLGLADVIEAEGGGGGRAARSRCAA